jgi:hypothetical protein
MTGPVERADDDVLLGQLGEALRMYDEPPADVVTAAKDLFTWRTIDAELAALTFDSLLDDERAAVRSTSAPPRVLTFEAHGLTVELEVETGPAGRRLLGQLVPPVVGELDLDTAAGTQRVSVEGMGRFVADLPDEPQRIVLRLTAGPSVVTMVAVL